MESNTVSNNGIKNVSKKKKSFNSAFVQKLK